MAARHDDACRAGMPARGAATRMRRRAARPRGRAACGVAVGLLLAGLLAAAEAGAQSSLKSGKTARSRPVVGWIETVAIEPGDLRLRAKLDTGARTSSLNAPDFRLFERDGVQWVAFTVTNRDGREITLERKVVRSARIKRIQGPSQVRPVVMLTLCIGNIYGETEVNLVNRAGFNYEMLIGRRFLARRFAVDPARALTVEPDCPDVQ